MSSCSTGFGDRPTAFSRGERLVRNEGAPAGVRVLQFYPSADGSMVTCLWEAGSVEEVQEYVDSTLGDSSRNTCYEADADRRSRSGPWSCRRRRPSAPQRTSGAGYFRRRRALAGWARAPPGVRGTLGAGAGAGGLVGARVGAWVGASTGSGPRRTLHTNATVAPRRSARAT